jgi:type VI protein secretion system component VasK
MILFDAIYDRVTGGTIGNWLAIIGLLSLMYWAWLIVAALQRRKAATPSAPVVAAAQAAPAAARAPPQVDPAADDIAVIAAAVQAMLGGRRMVRLPPDTGDSHWASDGRWMQQMSHQPR